MHAFIALSQLSYLACECPSPSYFHSCSMARMSFSKWAIVTSELSCLLNRPYCALHFLLRRCVINYVVFSRPSHTLYPHNCGLCSLWVIVNSLRTDLFTDCIPLVAFHLDCKWSSIFVVSPQLSLTTLLSHSASEWLLNLFFPRLTCCPFVRSLLKDVSHFRLPNFIDISYITRHVTQFVSRHCYTLALCQVT